MRRSLSKQNGSVKSVQPFTDNLPDNFESSETLHAEGDNGKRETCRDESRRLAEAAPLLILASSWEFTGGKPLNSHYVRVI
jgi:hypothetical protein